ncbi:YbhB/YbcL family Raf kinase inhibitor-like protein [Variovorax sp. J22R133]|uniref:YbhB/YbcL family Raf kinase inhibitor-like protein n=1 Tax=Variovorax brevis TaxID=3053503 RepID=UPI002578E097|nr:YbhB/YbcL family Raf kinase inhibitor-like protein [Variovorax sp. J22R133]MDM0117101.1 YbhB/YbcL family Raf kinase inhibitor-like protein [Variovorax sp. J22R133]
MLEHLPGAVGHALHEVRAGLDHIAFNTTGLREGMASIVVSTLAFADHAPIPERYTADGEGVSPPLSWASLPPATESVLLLVEDADSPTPHPLVHAIVVGLRPDVSDLAIGDIDDAEESTRGFIVGRNSSLRAGWLPPDPPPGHGVHRYAFQVFALNAAPGFDGPPGREEVLDILRSHAIASGLLIGTYERPDGSIKQGAEPASTAEAATLRPA